MTGVDLEVFIETSGTISGTTGRPPKMPRNALRRDGSSQSGRFPEALGNTHFQIDERKLEDLLDFCSQFSNEVSYYGFDDTVSGNWSSFFANDPSLILAEVLRYPTRNWKEAFDQELAGFTALIAQVRMKATPLSSVEKQEIKALILTLIGGISEEIGSHAAPAALLNQWKIRLSEFGAVGSDFRNTLNGQVKKQMQDLIRLRLELNLFMDLGTPVFQGEDFEWEEDPWEWNKLKDIAPFQEGSAAGNPKFAKGSSVAAKLDNIYAGLARIGTSIAKSVQLLQKRCKTHFEHSINDNDAHGPHLGLFIAFLQVFQQAQGRLNEIGPRHLDFYYKKGLGFQAKVAQPDSAHLIAELSTASNQINLPSGTQFPAKDGRIYSNRKDWNLNSAKIVDFRTDITEGGSLQAFRQVMKEKDVAGEVDSPPETARIGWAIASPMLLMAEGKRECWISFGVDPDTSGFANLSVENRGIAETALKNICKLQISAEEEWLEIADFDIEIRIAGVDANHLPGDMAEIDNLVFNFVIPTDAAAIINYDADVHEGDFDSNSPMLKFSIEGDYSAMIIARNLLSKLNLGAFGIDLHVSEMRNMRLENDEGDLIGSEPFLPFGQSPTSGNKFYVDAREALAKGPQSIELNWRWKELPEVPFHHYFAPYRAYYAALIPGEISSRESNYKVEASYFVGSKLTTKAGNNSLFSFLNRNIGSVTFGPENLANVGEASVQFETDDVTMRQEAAGGFLRLNLQAPEIGFGHAVYPGLLAQASIALANLKELSNNAPELNYLQKPYVAGEDDGSAIEHSEVVIPINPPARGQRTVPVEYKEIRVLVLPEAPITPTMAYCKMSYKASRKVSLDDNEAGNSFWQVDHHGHVLQPKNQQITSLISNLNQGAYMYLGIEGLTLPEQLSILFQLKQGSGDANLELPNISWSVLSGNKWNPIPNSQIASDRTEGLRKSGIIVLNLLQANTENQTAMPADLTWLRIEIDGAMGGLDKLAGIHLNAFEVSLADIAAPESHGKGVLAAKSLGKPSNYVDGLQAINQPYASFGGAKEESNTLFQSRVAERLRHKNRSISIWDYERIVLARYPEIYKVNCLNHYQPKEGSRDNEMSPGHIALICIPKTPNLLAPNPLEPYCRRDLLQEVEAELQPELPPFAELHVLNPIYIPITVSFSVVFNAQADAGLATLKLNEAIAKYLCPWAFDEAEEIHFGGKVHPSQLLNLLEQQAEVDVVADFQVEAAGLEPNPEGYFEASQSRMVLVSAQKHGIEVVSLEDLKCEGAEEYGGINFWRINQDFIVNGN